MLYKAYFINSYHANRDQSDVVNQLRPGSDAEVTRRLIGIQAVWLSGNIFSRTVVLFAAG